MMYFSRIKELVMEALFIVLIVFIFIGIFINRLFLFIGISLIFVLFLTDFLNSIIKFKGKLPIKTPDGSNQPYHPSVVYFDKKWNNYRYWMAYTPFPIGAQPYMDRWEYPCIISSNDGVNWEYANSKKPLDDLTEEQIENRDYFSDTHLIYNKDKKRLECFYRLNEHNGETADEQIFLYRRVSYNGTDWSQREMIADSRLSDTNNLGSPIISPAIEMIDNKYNIWYVTTETEVNENMKIYYSYSNNAYNWNERQLCTLSGYNVDPWHIDCKYYGGVYWLLIYDFTHKLTLWSSTDGIHFDFKKVILRPSRVPASFYSKSLYRACMLKDNASFYIYFSSGNGRKHAIGLMKGKSLTELKVVSAANNYSVRDFVVDLFEKYTRISRYVIRKLKRMIKIPR